MSKQNRIDRRSFVTRTTGAVAGVAALGACASDDAGAPAVHTQPNVRWRLASSFPRSLDTLYGINDYLAERVSQMSDGRFTIRPYPAGEIVPALQVLDAVQQGTVQFGETSSYYYTGKNPALAFDTGVPFGLTTRQQFAWLYEGGGLELTRELFADFNIINFPAGSTGAQMGGWFRREISQLSDLGGLKMRIPGLGGEVMSRLGVAVQVIAGGEIYQALERGAIDATEWVGPHDDERLGLHQVANFYYSPGWWETGPSLSFYVNRDAWETLPTTYQEILRGATMESAMTMTARYDSLNPQALERLIAAGVELRTFSRDIMEAAYRTSFDLYEEQAAADAGYRKLYEQWKQFRAGSYRWFKTVETEYTSFAFEYGD